MQWHEVELDGSRTTAFPERAVPGHGQESAEHIGGYLRGGKWGWVTCKYSNEATMLVCATATGESVARHTFWSEDRPGQEDVRCSIQAVEEMFPGQVDVPSLVAISLEVWSAGNSRPQQCSAARTQLIIYSVAFDQVLRRFDLDSFYCSALVFLDDRLCQGTHLSRFDGCLAVASEEGLVLLLDINCKHLLQTRNRCIRGSEADPSAEVFRLPCVGSVMRIDSLLDECRSRDAHLAVEVDVARIGIRCLASIRFAPGFAAGLEDGTILIYDLVDFHLTTVLRAPPERDVSVERICCILPPDDPKPCFYVCAMYLSSDRLSLQLHSVSYRRSHMTSDGEGYRFQGFHSSLLRNQQVFDQGKCSIIGCTTASTFSFAGDNGTLLAILSWHSHAERRNKLVLFDINQWYKDEMPPSVRHRETPHYLAGYILSGLPKGLALELRPNTILHFISLHRFDEHFYPESLTFDCSLLTSTGCRYYAQDGVQHRFLNALRWERATLFLNPQPYHEQIVRLRLMPQFSELHPDATVSKAAMYDEILSVALEHKCVALLNDCARSWLDGSFLCNTLDSTQLSLSTLTNWIVRRAGLIKAHCSELCQGIFDYGGYSLDERERREYQALSSQLRELLRLQTYILEQGNRSMPPSILMECETNKRALQTVLMYQRVLYWFIEQALLPEGQHMENNAQRESVLVRLRRSYADLRKNKRTLYIDALGKRTGLSNAYPPETLQSLLYLMLNPDTQTDRKHALVLYFLMDLAAPKLWLRFQGAFQISDHLVLSVRSFWFLDHGDFEECVRELYEAATPITGYEEWQSRLLLETLLDAGAPEAAMRVVSQPPGPVDVWLHLRILLANESIPEAFHMARLYDEEETQPLLERFFQHCIDNRRFKVLAELCLREPEERLVYRLLRKCRSRQTECVQLILLLQKSKYIEAVSFMDEVADERQREDDSSSTIISAYRSTMAPVAQNIAGTYFQIRGKLDRMNQVPSRNWGNPEPFSCQLVKQNASGEVGGIFQCSALSAHWATRYDELASGLPAPGLSVATNKGHSNIPFLRRAQYGLSEQPRRRRVVKPVLHQVAEKRQREQEELQREERHRRDEVTIQPRKRRRLLGEQLVEDMRGHVNKILGKSPAQKPESETDSVSRLLQPPSFVQSRQSTNRQGSSSPVAVLKPRPAIKSLGGTPLVATSTKLSGTKRFRFMPPIPLRLDGSMEVDGEEPVDEDAESKEEVPETEEEETDEIIMAIESRSDPQATENSESEDEFLSPMASANVSLANQSEVVAEASPRIMGPPRGPQPRSSLFQGRNGNGNGNGSESSGFGSFATVQASQTSSQSQFVPTICSSKMYETHSQMHLFSGGLASTSSGVKISERTTICGDMESTDLIPETTAALTAASSEWSMPQSRAQGQPLQMMDTTLGMSTYDVTSLEPREQEREQAEEPREELEEEVLELEESIAAEMQQEEQTAEQDQERASTTEANYQIPFMASSEAPVQEPLYSPTYSLSSEESSELSSYDHHRSTYVDPMRPTQEDIDNPLFTTETGSIVSYHSSASNVSVPIGAGEDGSLYRANSLETVDDLDTTKGSVEEAEEDYEDDCVIALDGTEVRGYVARPEQPAACSSAELFAFKDECQEEAVAGSCPSLSLGATANSDSVVADTIVLDSDSESRKDREPDKVKSSSVNVDVGEVVTVPVTVAEEPASSNDSVATVSFTETKQAPAQIEEEMVVLDEEEKVVLEKVQPVVETEPEVHYENEIIVEDEEEQPAIENLEVQTVIQQEEEEKVQEEEKEDEMVVDNEEDDEEQELVLVLTDEEKMEIEDSHGNKHDMTLEVIQEEEDSEDDCVLVVPVEPIKAEQKTKKKSSKDTSKQKAKDRATPDPRPAQEEDSKQSFMSEDDDRTPAIPTSTRTLRARRSTSIPTESPAVQTPPVSARKLRLRSSDAVSTPRRRPVQHKHLLEVIDEGSPDTPSLPRTRSRTRLSIDSDAPAPGSGVMARSKRATSLLSDVQNPAPRLRRGISEPPSPAITTTPVRGTRRAVRSRKNSKVEEEEPPEPEPEEEEKPRLRRTTRRRASELSDKSDKTDKTDPPSPGTSAPRQLRLRIQRVKKSEAEAAESSAPSQRSLRTPPISEGSNEANVPPKKRGRSKK
ncbi:protein ELYS homolog isoform X2 [Drosophila bipectinata]|uniref:protein ELYS homolog isoform X2 n=1 Tax=Drosophila bipectinata TaxID=42026 RepID=UPI0038B263D5